MIIITTTELKYKNIYIYIYKLIIAYFNVTAVP